MSVRFYNDGWLHAAYNEGLSGGKLQVGKSINSFGDERNWKLKIKKLLEWVFVHCRNSSLG